MSNIWRWQLLAAVIGIITSLSVVIGTSVPDKDIVGPLIIPNKNEIILKQGQNFTLSCKSNFPIKIEQQEIPEEIVVPFTKVSRNSSNSDEEYEYTFELDLYNVNQFTVGYYACFDSNLNGSDIFKNMLEEPTDTEYISYIYIYVDDTGIFFAPMREVVIVQNKDSIVIECKPTTPDVNITLFGQPSNKIIKPLKYSPKIGFLAKKGSSYVFQCYGRRGNESKWKRNITYRPGNALVPNIEIQSKDFLEGETFSLNCTITYQPNSPVSLSWKPVLKVRASERTNENSTIGKLLYRSITIVNATKDDAGIYTCISKSTNGHAEKTAKKNYLGSTGYVNVFIDRSNRTVEKEENNTNILKFFVKSYPKADFKIYKNEELLPNDTSKYSITYDYEYNSVILKINKLTVHDTANYTLTLSNKYQTKSDTYILYVKAKPVILKPGFPEDDRFYPLGSKADFQCTVVGYPLPNLYWIFSDEKGNKTLANGHITKDSLIQVSSIISIVAYVSGNITCLANNSFHKTPQEYSRRFLVSEVADGFGIDKNDERLWFYEGQQLVKKCYASIYQYTDVKWLKGDEDLNVSVQITNFSLVSVLNISKISEEDSGEYTCVGYTFENITTSDSVTLDVSVRTQGILTLPETDVEEEIKPYQKVSRSCRAEAVPPPVITWFKNGDKLPKENISYELVDTHGTVVVATIDVVLIDEHESVYECIVESGGFTVTRSYNFVAMDNRKSEIYYIYVIAVILFFLVIVVAYLLWKMRKDRKFKRELLKAGLLYFKKGVPKSINPELGIDEQAELLPYDERFEFPIEKLQIGKQLGAGAFGVVYKAEARGIIDAEVTTPVAVKMVKKTADNMYIKALASELKIMVHLGKHVNIVNLLGACTKNVAKRELSVIVEYCKFGNIHNYMQKHRQVFIDQLTDNKEKNLGKVNRGFESTTGSSGTQSDYFGSNHTQETDHTFVNTANTNRSVRKASETGYVQPEWRTNYESDYIDGRNPRPLASRDLLAWAFQIARGMEYLANKKVLHGDLAARNVLLAEDNIVKICDFGLARSIYKNDEYQKQENSPLPVKWLAIECMTDRIFSTQSDVWSFGIVLWELFTLAKTPYPNVSPSCLVQWLSDGHRLEKPQYADDRLYDVMLRCWQQKPTARPNFGQLQETLGSFLEDNVRNHYVDLNSVYMDFNMKTQTEEDYLARMCAPDYNNMVTPSPHHYVNETRSFFPPTPNQLQHDDEGYLQMSPINQSIFSPRAQNTKFDFDSRRLSPIRKSDACHGPGESTPMLSLNNLPIRSGSESDQEGSVSPYLNMCPRIEEEIDEVFEKQNNFKNTQNNQNSAVTNPTYITFDSDLEKKPQNISNNYINVNVPNGLVK